MVDDHNHEHEHEHEHEEAHECGMCGTTFDTEEELKIHAKEEHDMGS